MTLKTEELSPKIVPLDIKANPPPTPPAVRHEPLFESMEELRARQGEAHNARHFLLRAAAALLAGLIVFAALYSMILFLE